MQLNASPSSTRTDLNAPNPAAPQAGSAPRLALFDLDNTLLPIDSDYEWARFLIRLGLVDEAEYERRNDVFFQQYKDGTLDIHQFLEFQLAPLAAHPRAQLDAWHAQFMREVIAPQIRPSARELVDSHRQRGDLCAIVTATNAFVTGPIAHAFGIEHLIATTPEAIDGRFTGRSVGVASFREGKVTRTEQWLAELGQPWNTFGRSYFYSDSANDLPLLERVSDPVATNPDPRLAAHADAKGWPILRLFE
ncbi:MAG: HAD family phosphatase [Burkholderiales bacterium]|jgi:HAD superfamily hydrolase (TIGR01490 family)|nr:HAD family phosphatase [Burkholderiales bacterium]